VIIAGALLAAVLLIVIFHALVLGTVWQAAVAFSAMALAAGIAAALWQGAEVGLFLLCRSLRRRELRNGKCPACGAARQAEAERLAQAHEQAAIERAHKALDSGPDPAGPEDGPY
jgi:hypothetical protein